MSEIFFTADLHFGHAKVAGARGFISPEQMSNVLVENYNHFVTKHDKVYILGDVAWTTKGLDYLRQLNGYKVIVMGNHDYKMARKYLEIPNVRIEGVCQKTIGDYNTVLTHIPIHPSEFYRWDVNIHGHLHDKQVMQPRNELGFIGGRIPDSRYINVSLEQYQLKPVPFDEIHQRIERGPR